MFDISSTLDVEGLEWKKLLISDEFFVTVLSKRKLHYYLTNKNTCLSFYRLGYLGIEYKQI